MNLGDSLNYSGSDRIALIDLSNDQTRAYTYNDLDQAIQGVATRIAAEKDQRIGLLGANSAEFVTTLFAIMRSGAVAVPMNTKFPDETLHFVAQDANLYSAYIDRAEDGRLPESLHVEPLLSLELDKQASYLSHTPELGDAGMVLYTSGSTGRPKGVLLSHDSQWAMVSRMKELLAQATGIIAAPLYHMNGLLFLMSLFAGRGTVVLMPRFSARQYLQAIHDHRVNVITGVPTMLTLMLKEADLIESLDLSSVVAIQVGSAPLSETLIEQVQTKFPNARISNGYGTTEAGAGMFGAHPDRLPVPSLALGYPQAHVEVRLVGGASQDEGVLEVKTPAAMSGYLNLPEKTAEKMSDDGWINTGDIMRRDERGFYYFVGRDDDMFNCGGENIYPGEVERILEQDSRIAECCVVPVPDEVKGQKPVAFVVLAEGREMQDEDVKAVALAQAPAYMHPREVYFLATMPLAGTNKIDRHALATLAAERTSSDRD